LLIQLTRKGVEAGMHALAIETLPRPRPRKPVPPLRTRLAMTARADFAALVAAVAASRDRAAFTALFVHFAPRVKSYLLQLGTSAETAEELAQETLLAVWRRAPQFDPMRAAPSTWIFAIARNLRIDLARRERRPLPGEEREPIEQPDALVAAAEDGDRLRSAVGRLPAEQAEVLRLAFFADKPHAEIAALLRLPLGTVKSRIRLAMAKLHAILEPSP
jgi:RNA polymerase sigma-70 factor (ECF subfamily)